MILEEDLSDAASAPLVGRIPTFYGDLNGFLRSPKNRSYIIMFEVWKESWIALSNSVGNWPLKSI